MFIAINLNNEANKYDDFNDYMQYHDDVLDIEYAIVEATEENKPAMCRKVFSAELARWFAEYKSEQGE